MKTSAPFDVIILGGSYAGLATAMALGRALRRVLVIDSGLAANRQTPYSHNFLTNDGRPPLAIAEAARREVEQYRHVMHLQATAIAAAKTSTGFSVTVQSGDTYQARKLILATGIKDIMPAIEGFAACWGISVLHCPYCHGYEVRGQKTGILANGDNGFEFAALIANWTNDVTLFTNGPSGFTQQQAIKLQKKNISIVETPIKSLEHHKGYLSNLIHNNGTASAVNALYARLPFVQHTPIPQLLGCELTPEGYIVVNQAQQTTVGGVFACGDNVSRMRTVANAVAMGTATGIMVNKELITEDF